MFFLLFWFFKPIDNGVFFFLALPYIVLRNPHFSVRPKPGRLFFFELSLCCEAISTVILEVCNPISIRGAAMGCCYPCVVVQAQSLGCKPAVTAAVFPVSLSFLSKSSLPFSPKSFFLEHFHCKPLVVSLSLASLLMKSHELTSFYWMLFSCPICVICRKHHGIVG